jgi:uncharacterized protein
MQIMANIDAQPSNSYLDWSNRGEASVWRYCIGTLLMLVVFFVLSGMAVLPLAVLVPHYKDSLTLSVLATLLQFVVAFFAMPLIVRVLHKRPSWSLALPSRQFRSWDFFSGLLVASAIAALTMFVFDALGVMPLERNPKFDPSTLLLLAALGFIGIFIQAGSEELLFRGYFMQFTRRLTSSKFLVIGTPALLFAAPHVANIAAFGGGALAMTPYLIAGLLYGWAAYRSGSLWMSVALHLANNYTSLVFVGTRGDALPSAAPFLVQVPSLPAASLAVLIQSAAIFAALSLLMKRAGR